VSQFAVRGDVYNVSFERLAMLGGRRVYAFSVKRPTAANFSITGLYLDAARFLPVRETFAAHGGGCAGGGAVSFAPAGNFWLPVSVDAVCSVEPSVSAKPDVLAQPRRFRESIRFFAWRFPKAIPRQVFGAPAPAPALNAGAPTPAPALDFGAPP
jgi:hypothetical protein